MTRKIWTLLLAVTVFSALLLPQDYSSTQIVSVVKNEENLRKLLEIKPDILMEKDGKIYIVADYEDLSNFQLKVLDFTVETQNFYPYSQQNASVEGGINGDFHSYPELERDLFALESSYPGLAQVSVLGTSLENRNIYALKISDNVASESLIFSENTFSKTTTLSQPFKTSLTGARSGLSPSSIRTAWSIPSIFTATGGKTDGITATALLVSI